jgi:hypothetical protein
MPATRSHPQHVKTVLTKAYRRLKDMRFQQHIDQLLRHAEKQYRPLEEKEVGKE